jgi:hypothetical protein
LAHIDDMDGFQAGLSGSPPGQPRLIRAHHASPENLLGGQKQVLVEGIRPDGRLDRPFLDIANGNAGIALVPPSVEVFSDRFELNRQVVG